jgi:hypothetical protein
MVFNYCIYGTIDTFPVDVTCWYYNYSLDGTTSKTISVNTGEYQFNLGDEDFLNLNNKVSSELNRRDTVLIEVHSGTDKIYSEVIELELGNFIHNHNIITAPVTETTSEANFNIAENLVKTTNYAFNEINTDLWNYFRIKNITTDTVINENNTNLLRFTPNESHQYEILQRSLNKTSNIVTEKIYTFNAIVSAATITRSNKCKGINDAIKILFMGNDIAEAIAISIIKDDTVIETGTLASEFGSLYSYNFVFPAAGHYCFVIKYHDEVFLTSFRVLRNNFKVYYSDEHHRTGLNINSDYYSLTDLTVSLGTETFNEVQDGIYCSNELEIEYGDYMFNILGEDFVSGFEECAAMNESSDINSDTLTEEVYWIFPNNIGD